MKRPILAAVLLAATTIAGVARGHIEAQYTLGRVASESTNILIMEVTRINKEKNLVIWKKVRDLKGQQAGEEIKQNIGQRGEPGDSQAVMEWAQVGRQALLFYNESGSLTCIGPHWYQAFKEGEWWAMSHAEVYMTRTYYGDVAQLFPAVEQLLAGKEVVIPCLADGPREAIVKKSGKVQTMKASLKLIDYNPQRDVVAAATSEKETTTVLAAGSGGWKVTAAANVNTEKPWRGAEFDDKAWTIAKAPVGYGEPEISARKGTTIKEQGQAILLRRTIDISSDLLSRKDLRFELKVASDDSASVSINGKTLSDDKDDHEFAYWNQTVTLPADAFRAGPNVIAARVRNTAKSSDLYFDLELSAEFEKPEKK
jgi:hypothetical protein